MAAKLTSQPGQCGLADMGWMSGAAQVVRCTIKDGDPHMTVCLSCCWCVQ
jgi:hypothetical protein